MSEEPAQQMATMRRPKILEDVGFDIYVDTLKLRDLPLPVEQKDLSELIWCFDFPVWEKDGTDDWNLTPWAAVEGRSDSSEHKKKIDRADLSFPIVIIWNKERWVILDGIHRLAKAYLLGEKTMKVKVVTKDMVYFKNAQIDIENRVGNKA